MAVHGGLLGLAVALPLAWMEPMPEREPIAIEFELRREIPPPFEALPEPPRDLEQPDVPLVGVEVVPVEVAAPEEPEPLPPEPLESLFARSRPPTPAHAIFAAPEPEPEPLPEPEVVPPPPPPVAVAAPVEVAPEALDSYCPKPAYPRTAQRMGWQGVVVCRIEVAADGNVRGVEILESSGHELLDSAVVETVRDWRFRPGTRDGMPAAMEVVRRFRFEIASPSRSA